MGQKCGAHLGFTGPRFSPKPHPEQQPPELELGELASMNHGRIPSTSRSAWLDIDALPEAILILMPLERR